MRYLKSNGKRLTVREIGPVQYELEAIGRVPLPILDEIVDDDTARARLKSIAAMDHAGSYERVPLQPTLPLTGKDLDGLPPKPKRKKK